MACRDCARGSLHTGTPAGFVQDLHGFQAYVTDPPDGQPPKGICVIIPDAFGWELLNTRILADNYTERTGCRTLVPEFMNGASLPISLLDDMEKVIEKTSLLGNIWKIPSIARAVMSFVPWRFYNRFTVCQPRVISFFKALREANPQLGVVAAGFCWGGLYTINLASDLEKTSDGKSLIDAGFTAHPSLLTVPNDIEAIVKPISTAIGDADIALPHPKSLEAKAILEKKGDQHEWIIIPGAKHGFAVRANNDNEDEYQKGMQAEDQAVNFFKRHLRLSDEPAKSRL